MDHWEAQEILMKNVFPHPEYFYWDEEEMLHITDMASEEVKNAYDFLSQHINDPTY